MSNFKRNNFSRPSGPTPRSEGNNGGGYQSRNQRDSAQAPRQQSEFPFTKIGGITIAKSVADEVKKDLLQNLRGNEDVKLMVKAYLPKGVNEIVIKTGDVLLIDFRVSEKDKDFVIGKLSIAND